MLDDRAPTSLKFIYVQSGDIVYLPAGTIVCEKAVGAHNIMLRAHTTVLSDDTADSCMFIAGACPVKILGVGPEFIFHVSFRSTVTAATAVVVQPTTISVSVVEKPRRDS